MTIIKKMWSILVVVLALGLGAGCASEDEDIIVYSYNIEELGAGLFGAMSPTMTMNEWVSRVTNPSQTYDQWVQRRLFLYQDENLKTPFAASDIVDENTIIYCSDTLNGQGRKIGEITGTITLNDIPPAAKVYIQNWAYINKDEGWFFNRKIDIQETTVARATVNWSLPVYESLRPNSGNTFELVVLPGDSLKAYTVAVRDKKTISDANAAVGNLGPVSVKGVTLSGTINVTHNGEPVPYVELHVIFEVQGTLNITCLSSPGPDAPWSVTFGRDRNDKDIKFQVFGYSEKNGTLLLDKFADTTVYIRDNQSMSGIVLNVKDQ